MDIDGWWSYLEGKILEGVTFKDIEKEKVRANHIAPWIPPACRGNAVNTEHIKCNEKKHRSPPTPTGCPKMFASLICEGVYDPLNLGSVSQKAIHTFVTKHGVSPDPHLNKLTSVNQAMCIRLAHFLRIQLREKLISMRSASKRSM